MKKKLPIVWLVTILGSVALATLSVPVLAQSTTNCGLEYCLRGPIINNWGCWSSEQLNMYLGETGSSVSFAYDPVGDLEDDAAILKYNLSGDLLWYKTWGNYPGYSGYDGLTDDNGATNTSSKIILSILNPPPQIIYWFNNKTNNETSVTINKSESIWFNTSANQQIITWHWYVNGVAQNNNVTYFAISWEDSGLNIIEVNASNANGTSNTICWDITVRDITTPTPSSQPVPPPAEEYPYQYVYANLAGYDNTVKAGETVTIEGKVSNTGSKDGNSTITVKLVPKVCDYDDYPYYPANVVDPTWASVTPEQATLEAGDTEYFNISVTIPVTASAGYYEGMIAISSDDYPDWEYTLYYNVQVYKLLNELVVETFSVPPNSSKLVATVSWSINENELSGDGSTMDVKLYSPGGEQISPEAEMTRISGYLDAYSYNEPTPEPGMTKSSNVYEEHTVRYLIANPVNGTWRLEMQPTDMMNFNYNLVVNPITEWY